MATRTITTTAPQDTALRKAFGRHLGLDGPATDPQIKAATIQWWRDIVRADDRQTAIETASQTAFDPS